MKSVNGSTHRSNAYYDRVVLSVKRLLASKGFVAPIDFSLSLDLVDLGNINKWRAGNIDYFERIIRCNLSKATQIMRVLKFHALEIGLRPSNSVYLVKVTKRPLKFSKSANHAIETAYATNYVGIPAKSKIPVLENQNA